MPRPEPAGSRRTGSKAADRSRVTIAEAAPANHTSGRAVGAKLGAVQPEQTCGANSTTHKLLLTGAPGGFARTATARVRFRDDLPAGTAKGAFARQAKLGAAPIPPDAKRQFSSAKCCDAVGNLPKGR